MMTQNIPILLYHSISEHSSPQFKPWAVSPKQFRLQLHYLKVTGHTPLTISEYAECQKYRRFPSKPVLITFDDGFEDFYTEALPILQEFNFNATLYITTGFIGYTSRWLDSMQEGHRQMLSVEQLIELKNQGIEIGAHTVTHPQLDTIPEVLAWREIYESKRWLESILSEDITSFAYPHGYYTQKIRQMVIDLGFISACGVKHAMSHPVDDRYSMARIIVKNGVTIQEFKQMLAGKGLRTIQDNEQLKTRIWRAYRQARNTTLLS